MTTQEGGFCASLDADSEGEEGKFYVWSRQEIEEVLGAENAAFFAAFYDVSAGGNFEGHNILNRLNDLPRSIEDEHRLGHAAPYAAQKARNPGPPGPRRQDPGRLERADDRRSGQCRGHFRPPGLAHSCCARLRLCCAANGAKSTAWAFLAGRTAALPGPRQRLRRHDPCCAGALRGDGDRTYLERALAWQSAFDVHYADPDTGGYYLSADDADDLLLRPHSTPTTPRPIRTRWRRATWCGSPCCRATTAGAPRPTG